MKLIKTIAGAAALSLSVISMSAAAQSVPLQSNEDVPVCTAEGIMELVRVVAEQQNTTVRNGLEGIVVSGYASSWEEAASLYQSGAVEAAHNTINPQTGNSYCRDGVDIKPLLLQEANITSDTPLPRTQAQIEAEQAAAAAEQVVTQAELATRRQQEAALTQRVQQVSGDNPSERTQRQNAMNQLENVRKDITSLTTRISTLETQMRSKVSVAQFNNRFDPSHPSFFLKDPAVVTAIGDALQERFDVRYVQKTELTLVEQQVLRNSCELGTATEEECATLVQEAEEAESSWWESSKGFFAQYWGWVIGGLFLLIFFIAFLHSRRKGIFS